MPIGALFLGICNLVALKLASVFGVKLHCMIFIIIYSASLYLLGIVSDYRIGLGIVGIMSASYGMCNIVTLYACWNYYPKRKGMVTGILLSSHGFLGVFFNFVII